MAPDPKSPEAEQAALKVLDGYEISLFASEADGVAKPIQMRWDDRGRLWVACSTTYPQIEPGEKPNDKIVVLEDTNGDGRADKSTVFADGLLMPMGLEIAGDGAIYVGAGTELLLLRDTDGDLKADRREVVFSGFGTGDAHQMINSFSWGPGGELWISQGAHTFSNVETPHGVERLYSAGVWRMRPRTLRLDPFLDSRRGHPTNSWAGPANPWGFAFDEWGQLFCNDAAGNKGLSWITPALIRSDRHVPIPYMWRIPKGCGIDIVGTAHMPDEMQGRLILGHYFTASVRQFAIRDDAAGFALTEMPALVTSSDNAFRIVDVKIGPDGAIYLCDWYNPVIGHYQASYRDPARDKTRGRIWRLSAKGRAPTKQPDLAAMSAGQLLDELLSPDRWRTYQARRLLFLAPTERVVPAVDAWVAKLDPADPQFEHLLYSAIGIYQSHEAVRPELLARLMRAKDYRARAYAARVVGHWHDRLESPLGLLRRLVQDEHPRVRVEAIVACTFVSDPHAIEVAAMAADKPIDQWIDHAMLRAVDAAKEQWRPAFARGELDFGGKVERLSWVLRSDGTPEVVEPVRAMVKAGEGDAETRSDLAVLLASIGTADDLLMLLDKFRSQPRVLREMGASARVRNVRPGGDAGRAVLALFDAKDAAVRLEAMRLAGAWRVMEATSGLRTIAVDGKQSADLRVAAIAALAEMKATQVSELEPLLAPEQPALVRLAAIDALASTDLARAATAAAPMLGKLDSDADAGSLLVSFTQRKGGAAALAKAVRAASAAGALSPRAAQRGIDALHARGRDDAPLLEALRHATGVSEATPAYSEQLVRDLVAEAQRDGDAIRGREIYATKLAACAACHTIDGKGGQFGPDLSAIGRGLTPQLIVESVLWPRRQVKEGYLSISISTKEGEEFSGYAIADGGSELTLRDVAANVVRRIPKSSIARRVDAGTIMPEGMTAHLSPQELRDALRYLMELGK